MSNPRLTVVPGTQVALGQKFYPYTTRAQAIQLMNSLANPKIAKEFSWNINMSISPEETKRRGLFVRKAEPHWWCVVYNENPVLVDGHPEWGEVSL